MFSAFKDRKTAFGNAVGIFDVKRHDDEYIHMMIVIFC